MEIERNVTHHFCGTKTKLTPTKIKFDIGLVTRLDLFGCVKKDREIYLRLVSLSTAVCFHSSLIYMVFRRLHVISLHFYHDVSCSVLTFLVLFLLDVFRERSSSRIVNSTDWTKSSSGIFSSGHHLKFSTLHNCLLKCADHRKQQCNAKNSSWCPTQWGAS
jgi:hypothetical protein